MPAELQEHRRLTAIMFTDMVGYSALSQKNESLALELLKEHREILRAVFARHGGHEIEAVGDGFFVEFPSALAGARCAVEIQQALHERNATSAPERRIEVRIGMHLGDVVDQGHHVHGDGVNIAARIEPLAEPGGICLSEDVVRQIQTKIELPLRRLGRGELKNIRMAVDIYRLVLPWERAHLPGSERLTFGLRRRQVRRALIGTGGVLVVSALVGSWIWTRAQKHAPPLNNRIAVLPFVSMSANPDDEYFADGITEELISRLSRVKGLEVIARTSIASYKGTKKRIGEIAGELSVGTVLEGSVRKVAHKVRITAQLINAGNEAHLWSEDYDREFKDIFVVQSDIAQRVANSLAMRLSTVSTQPPQTGVTADLEAYSDYLKGRFYYNRGTTEGLHQAMKYYQEAIRRDPAFAVAYAALADTYEQLEGYEGGSEGRMPQARAVALKALKLDESLAEAHMALGVVKAFYDWDFPGAGEAFQRALALNPNSATAHDWYGWYFLYLRRWDEAISELRKAAQLDPVSITVDSDLGWALDHAGRWDEAIEEVRKIFELDPGNAWMLGILGWAYIGKGRYKEAVATFEKAVEASRRDSGSVSGLAIGHALSGESDRALKLLDEIKNLSKSQHGKAYFVMNIYRALAVRDPQYRDDVYRWLDKAYGEHDFNLVWLSASPAWPGDVIQTDPRLIAFRKKMGLPP